VLRVGKAIPFWFLIKSNINAHYAHLIENPLFAITSLGPNISHMKHTSFEFESALPLAQNTRALQPCPKYPCAS